MSGEGRERVVLFEEIVAIFTRRLRGGDERSGRDERGKRMSKAKTTRPYPLRIPEGLMELAEAKARIERTDRSTALRQFLYAGLKATC